jgi:hypothetical protein
MIILDQDAIAAATADEVLINLSESSVIKLSLKSTPDCKHNS